MKKNKRVRNAPNVKRYYKRKCMKEGGAKQIERIERKSREIERD